MLDMFIYTSIISLKLTNANTFDKNHKLNMIVEQIALTRVAGDIYAREVGLVGIKTFYKNCPSGI